MAGWIYFKGQGTPPQLWGRGRIKGEAALSLLYLVADAPEALVTRSYYCAPRPERGPAFTSRDRDPLLQPPGQWALRPPLRSQDGGSRLHLVEQGSPTAAPPSPRGQEPRPARAGEGKGRGAPRPAGPSESGKSCPGTLMRGGNRGHRRGHTARQLAAPRRGRHARRAGPGAPPPSPPTPPGLELPPRAGPAGSPQRRRAESRGNLLEPAALAAQARSVGPPPGWRRGHI